MSDDLRTRIVDINAQHRFADHKSLFGDKCVCGWTSHYVPHAEHLADAVIRELARGEKPCGCRPIWKADDE